MATLAVAIAAVLIVPSGCSTLPNPPCGDEPDTAVCSQLQYSCGTTFVCYSCGVNKRVNCGACAASQTCGGGGTPHVCWPPLVDGGEAGVADASGADGGDATAAGDAALAVDADDAMTDAPLADAEGGSDGSTTEAGDDAQAVAEDSGALADGALDGALDASTVASGDAASSPSSEDGGDDGGPAMFECSEDASPE